MTTLVFYISGHGFGHASRSIEIINALLAQRPDVRVIVRSSVAAWLVARTAHPCVELFPAEVDTGIVQVDSLHLDADASIARAEAFVATFEQRVGVEAAFLREQGASITVSDLPPLGIASATAVGIPAIASGNFTWDWIYEHYAAGKAVAQRIGEIYHDTTLALRMPMWGGFETIANIRDIPFVARRSRRDPGEVRDALGIPRGRPVVLTSFGGYGLEGLNADAIRSMADYHVIVAGMIDEAAMYDRGIRYEDLVRAVDVVVTKPGYGIISECLANGTALLYTSRGDFREYQVLVNAMPAFLRCAFIDHGDLFAGDWQRHLDALLAQPEPPTHPPTNGAEVAAGILSNILR